jgi:hypothetical protein
MSLIADADEWALIEFVRAQSYLLGLLSSPFDPGVAEQVRVRLARRALAEADGEGVIWTPLLDAIADSPHGIGTDDLASRLDAFKEWVNAQTWVHDLWPAAGFKFRALRHAVLRRVFVVNPSETRRILLTDPSVATMELVRQVGITSIHHAHLASWAEAVILKDDTAPATRLRFEPSQTSVAIDLLQQLANADALPASTLQGLIDAAIPPNEPPRKRRSPAGARSVGHLRGHAWAQIALLELARWVRVATLESLYTVRYADSTDDDWLPLLVERPDIPPSLLRRIAKGLGQGRSSDTWHALARSYSGRHDRRLRKRILTHGMEVNVEWLAVDAVATEWPTLLSRATTSTFLRRKLVERLALVDQRDLADLTSRDWGPLAQEETSRHQLEILALIPSARRSRTVRPRLLASDEPLVLYGLCLDGKGTAARELFRRLAACDPARAVQAAQRSSALCAALEPSDLVALLESEDQQARLDTMALLERFSGAPEFLGGAP